MSTNEHPFDEAYEAHAGWLANRPWAAALQANNVRAPANVAAAMRGKQAPPEMLVEGWLVRGVLHWLYADAEAGKTWLALVWARDVMSAGHTVIWVDEELGLLDIAQRLLALGVPAEVAEAQMVYYPFPGWTMNEDDREQWRNLLRAVQPSLVVIDTATDALANAGLSENDGADVTRWVKAFVEPATREHATTVVLDHTGRADGARPGKHAVGSRGKRAKAKVQYSMVAKTRYDRSTVGKVLVELTKNTLGAVIPGTVRTFRAGGDSEDHFVWEEQTGIDLTDLGNTAERDVKHRLVECLQAHPGVALRTTQLKQLVPGKDALKIRALAALADDNLNHPEITSAPGPSGSVLYTYNPTQNPVQ